MILRLALGFLLITGLLPAATRAEAEAQVKRYINRRFAFCEGEYLTTSFPMVRVIGGDGRDRGVYAGYTPRDYRGLRFTLKEIPLTTPDKLNGLTYKGGFVLQWDAARTWRSERSSWSPWGEGIGTERPTDPVGRWMDSNITRAAPPEINTEPSTALSLAQLGNKWYFDARPVEDFPATAPCSEMPPLDASKTAEFVRRESAKAKENAALAQRGAREQTCGDFFRNAPQHSGLNLRPVREDERLTGGLLVQNMDWAGCRSPAGDTPLLVAARSWNVRDTAGVLKQAPQTAAIRDPAGRTAADYATERLTAGYQSMDRATKAAWIGFIKDAGGTPPAEVVLEPLRVDAKPGEVQSLLLKEVQAFYTPQVIRSKVNRVPVAVQLRFLITTTGEVANVRIASTNPLPAAREAAVKALSQWKFKPPQRNGEPAELRADITVKVYPQIPE